MENESLIWETHEFEYREKNSDWYWILGIVAIIGALIAIVFGNLIFAVLIIVGSFVMVLFGSKHPDSIECEINNRGVRVEQKLYPYNLLESFWVDDLNEHKPKLLMTSKSTMALHIVIPIQDVSPDDVRNYLLKHIEEVEQSESFTERIMEWIKF